MFENDEAFYLGTRDGETAQKLFTQGTDQFIGFYGFASDTAIEAMGVLTQDVECSLNGGPEEGNDGNEGSGSGSAGEEDDEEAILETYAIILIIIGAIIFMIVLVSSIVYCKRAQKRRSSSKIEVLNNADHERM